MFQKKEIIYSGAIGVCQVQDITKLTEAGGQTLSYYVLRSVYTKSKVSYIPVENHQVLLRELISEEQAKELLSQMEDRDKRKDFGRNEIGEVAYVLKKKPEEICPEEEAE